MKYYNKINRNFNYNARLYFNKDSNNRQIDTTPRFWVELTRLNSVERVGFTDEGANRDYGKYASNFHHKQETISDADIESLSEEVKKIKPYGHGDNYSSTDKYKDNIKHNPVFQSFYKKYWSNNKDKIIQSDPYPYIEVNSINEVIKTSHLTPENPPSDTYDEDEIDESIYEDSFIVPPQDYRCAAEEINVNFEEGVFSISGYNRKPLFLGKNKRYVFNLVLPWEDDYGIDGFLHPLRFSTRHDGIHNGISSFDSGVNITGSAHSPGKVGETVTLITDDNTPRALYYYSPLDKEAGGFITFPQSCAGDMQIPYASTIQEADWHIDPRHSWATEYYLSKSTSDTSTTIAYSGIPDHGTGNPERGWVGFPNQDSTYGISGELRNWSIPKEPTPHGSAAHTVPVGPAGISLNGTPIFNARGEALPEGTTSFDSGHTHAYANIDSDGNGRTEWAVSPFSTDVKHRHQVTNWIVQESQSECYPNCEEEHGVDGVGAHSHLAQYKDKTQNLVFDACGGRPNSSGLYHCYKDPTCQYTKISGEHSPIVGYAFDGYPIYGPREESGIMLTSAMLDEYHGHNDSRRGWHYHVTNDFPYVFGTGYKGVPDDSNFNTAHDSEY